MHARQLNTSKMLGSTWCLTFANLKCCCYHLSSQNRPKYRMSSMVHGTATAPEALSNAVEMCGDFGCVGCMDRQDSCPVSGAVNSKHSGSDTSRASVVITKAWIMESDFTPLDSLARPVSGLYPREYPRMSCQTGNAADTSSWEQGLGSLVWKSSVAAHVMTALHLCICTLLNDATACFLLTVEFIGVFILKGSGMLASLSSCCADSKV